MCILIASYEANNLMVDLKNPNQEHILLKDNTV